MLSVPTKVDSRKKIHEVKFSMCKDVYIGNIQKTFNKIMDGHFSNLLRLLRKGKKSDSFAAHFKHHFSAITSLT